MSYATAYAPRRAVGSPASNAPPARQSSEELRQYLREMNARYQAEIHAAEEQEAVGVCFYCSAQQYEDLGFCCECGFSLLVENTVPVSLKGFRTYVADNRHHLYASSFQVSRKSFRVQRCDLLDAVHSLLCCLQGRIGR
jgi:hypothetical protein